MKIIRVTEDQFNSIWDKMTPMQRTRLDIAERNITLYSSNAVIVVAGEDTFPVVDLPEAAKSLSAVRYFAQKGTLDGFTPAPEPPKLPLSKYYEALAEAARKQEAEPTLKA